MDPEKEAIVRTLQELQFSIEEGNVENIENIIECFYKNLNNNTQLLSELYTSGTQCTTQTDLILAACQNKKTDILYYILKKTDILVHLTHDSFDDTEVNMQRTEAIKHALTLEDFKMVEMLYDFWCGNLHWSGHNIKNIEMVGNVLNNTRDACSDYDDQLRANFHCLLTFNAFQRVMYAELAKLDSSAITPKDTATMLLKVLRIYNEYSQIEKIREKHTIPEREQTIQDNINDKSSTFYINLEYLYYEVYFRKLDFNVSLLLLENLFVLRTHLKRRLNNEDDVAEYEGIESAIYHFVYSTSEQWRLYLPEKRQINIEEHTVIHKGIEKRTKLTLDLHKVYNGPVICLERESFKESFKKLEGILEEHVIRDDPALNNNSTLLKENYLRTVSYMRDHYSLMRIVNYIKAIEQSTDFKIVYYIEGIKKTLDFGVIMVERVLHVVGEMLKSSNESHHLSPSTQGLLQTALSVETIKHLQNIRNFLSHARDGQLSTRIEMANTQAQIFKDIKQELIIIKKIVNPIIDILKSISDKSLLENGLCLLEQRIKGLPDEAKRRVDDIYRRYKIHKNELVKSGNYYQQVWRPLGLTFQLLEEISWIMQNKAKILSNIQLAKTDISEKITRILPSLLPYARQILKPIIETIEKINRYDPSVQISKYPDAENIKEIRTKLKTLKKKNQRLKNIVDLTLLNKIENYKDHWETVKGMLSFCIMESELFSPIEVNVTDKLPVKEACNILADVEAICVMHGSTFAWLIGRRAVVLSLKIYRKYEDLRGITFNQKHFENIETLYEITCKKTKTDAPKSARKELISWLISRLDLLKHILMCSENTQRSQLVQKFDRNVKFRITLEMILADIANVLADCKIRERRLMNKSSMLLRDINLRNVLDHGNPFLEEIGDIFNSHDLAAELVDKALMFNEDSESIKALYNLFIGEIDYRSIKAGDLDKMDDNQKQLYIQFKTSLNWKSYALLTQYTIPKSQRPTI